MRLAALLLLASCATVRPTAEPPGRAHWSNVHHDYVHREVRATAVNSSTAPVVLDCSDARVVIPPRSEADVLIPSGLACDLQPEDAYQGAP